ncbi:MAG: HmuY family protein [Myxococcota bacterium]|nr:HmuY family protein [Myxococcota bacterium]
MKLTQAICWLLCLLLVFGCAEDLSERLEQGEPSEQEQQDEDDPSDGSEGSGPAADEDPSAAQDPSESSDTSDPSDATDATDPSDTTLIDESLITQVEQDDGSTIAMFDARASDKWVYLDFDAGNEVQLIEAEQFADWDIAFRRYKGKVNGGHHGEGQVIVSLLIDTELEDVSEAPLTPWTTDLPDSEEDDDEFPEYALGDWFNYDPISHILTPKTQVYVLRTTDGDFVKLAYVGYYDGGGESGFPSIQWSFIDGPSGELEEPSFPEVGEPPFVEESEE